MKLLSGPKESVNESQQQQSDEDLNSNQESCKQHEQMIENLNNELNKVNMLNEKLKAENEESKNLIAALRIENDEVKVKVKIK